MVWDRCCTVWKGYLGMWFGHVGRWQWGSTDVMYTTTVIQLVWRMTVLESAGHNDWSPTWTWHTSNSTSLTSPPRSVCFGLTDVHNPDESEQWGYDYQIRLITYPYPPDWHWSWHRHQYWHWHGYPHRPYLSTLICTHVVGRLVWLVQMFRGVRIQYFINMTLN